jgi:hypothetical protein
MQHKPAGENQYSDHLPLTKQPGYCFKTLFSTKNQILNAHEKNVDARNEHAVANRPAVSAKPDRNR